MRCHRLAMSSPVSRTHPLVARFLVLRGAPRELWVVFGTKLLTILAYGVMNSTLILWLSSALGFGDVGAGNLVTTWSAVMTLALDQRIKGRSGGRRE